MSTGQLAESIPIPPQSPFPFDKQEGGGQSAQARLVAETAHAHLRYAPSPACEGPHRRWRRQLGHRVSDNRGRRLGPRDENPPQSPFFKGGRKAVRWQARRARCRLPLAKSRFVPCRLAPFVRHPARRRSRDMRDAAWRRNRQESVRDFARAVSEGSSDLRGKAGRASPGFRVKPGMTVRAGGLAPAGVGPLSRGRAPSSTALRKGPRAPVGKRATPTRGQSTRRGGAAPSLTHSPPPPPSRGGGGSRG